MLRSMDEIVLDVLASEGWREAWRPSPKVYPGTFSGQRCTAHVCVVSGTSPWGNQVHRMWFSVLSIYPSFFLSLFIVYRKKSDITVHYIDIVAMCCRVIFFRYENILPGRPRTLTRDLFAVANLLDLKVRCIRSRVAVVVYSGEVSLSGLQVAGSTHSQRGSKMQL